MTNIVQPGIIFQIPYCANFGKFPPFRNLGNKPKISRPYEILKNWKLILFESIYLYNKHITAF